MPICYKRNQKKAADYAAAAARAAMRQIANYQRERCPFTRKITTFAGNVRDF